jgi:hypothetical protein
VGLGAETKEWRPALPLIFAVGGIPGVARDTTPAIITAPCHRSININKQNGRRAAAHAGDKTRSRGQGAPGQPSLCLLQAYSMGAFAEVARGPGCALGLQLLLFATLAQPKSLACTNFKAPKTRPSRNVNFPRFFSARLVAALVRSLRRCLHLPRLSHPPPLFFLATSFTADGADVGAGQASSTRSAPSASASPWPTGWPRPASPWSEGRARLASPWPDGRARAFLDKLLLRARHRRHGLRARCRRAHGPD